MTVNDFVWYRLFNLPEFIATGLVSRTLTLFLEGGPGEKNILITKGNAVSITYEDTFLPVEFAGQNPFITAPYAVYKDGNDDVWLGIEIE